MFAAMVALHTAILAGAVIEVLLLDRPFVPALAVPALVSCVLANVLRFWVIATLGPHWNVRVVPSMPLGVVTSGPYRYVRHPNYVAVFVELLALPLVHGAYLTALAGAALHAWILHRRVALEESVLMADESYRRAFDGKPRFVAMADVVIAGGGPAGATLALLLGRAGLSVEVFEAQRFPREKPCGEGIMPAGVAVLDRLGPARGGRRQGCWHPSATTASA